MDSLPIDILHAVFEGATPLRIIRELRQLSPDDLGKASGIDTTALARYEAGEDFPTPKEIERLAAALGVAPHDLDPSLER
ncbi:MAG TPA: helix-turn-helix transcriptional regulator [Azospirillaceae bacterium]|nr:helix-turn-helix transcriptional regulator [Azospirillaceae bacterium]